ncbi:MAG TPA: hypothetical protein VM717_00895 [Chthoniobacterales bacterium]|nr:hypothetical protein [Chthoniobacterales bacterium]
MSAAPKLLIDFSSCAKTTFVQVAKAKIRKNPKFTFVILNEKRPGRQSNLAFLLNHRGIGILPMARIGLAVHGLEARATAVICGSWELVLEPLLLCVARTLPS